MPHVDLPQGRIHFTDQGEGRPVVAVHGFLMGGELWAPLAGRLAAQGLRVLCPTWPMGAHRTAMHAGADTSPRGQAALVAAFCEALDLQDVVLLGNDSGGAVCQVVVTRHPERIGALVLTSCDAFDNFPPSFFPALVALARVPGALRAVLAPLRLAAVRRSALGYGLLTEGDCDHLAREWVRPALTDPAVFADLKAFTLGMRREVTETAARELPAFDRPVLLAWSAADRLFPMAHAVRLRELLPDARIEVVPGRTFSMLDHPDELARAITAFATHRATVAA